MTDYLIIKDLGGGVARAVCNDCDGTGLFCFVAEPHLSPDPCVRCKATGSILIMYYPKENDMTDEILTIQLTRSELDLLLRTLEGRIDATAQERKETRMAIKAGRMEYPKHLTDGYDDLRELRQKVAAIIKYGVTS